MYAIRSYYEKGCRPSGQPKHLLGHGADLPLGPAAAAQVEEVVQLPGVHGQNDLGFGCVGEHEAGILRRDPSRQEILVGAVDLVEQGAVAGGKLGTFGD